MKRLLSLTALALAALATAPRKRNTPTASSRSA